MEQSLAIPGQKALGTAPSIKAQGSATASELRVHFNAFISRLIHFLVPHLGLFTSFQRRCYLKLSELTVEVLPVHHRKTLYTTLHGGFIFLGKCGQMSDRSQSLSILIFSCTWRCTLENFFVLLVYFNLVFLPLPVAQRNGPFMAYTCESSKMLSFTKK